MKLVAVVSTVLLASCTVPAVKDAPIQIPIAVPEGVATSVLDLGPMAARMSEGDAAVNVQYGWFCQPAAPRATPTTRLPVSQADMARAFKTVFEPLHFQLKKPPDSVFMGSGPADLLLGGAVVKLQANVCFPFTGSSNLNVGDPTQAKGAAFVEVVWELYSTSEARVIYKTTTEGRFEAREAVEGGFSTIVLNAFAASLTNLAADQAFHAAAARRLRP